MLQDDAATHLKNSIKLAAEQLGRIATCFDHIRRLVQIQQPVRDRQSVPASLILEHVVEELHPAFQTRGVSYRLAGHNAQNHVLASRKHLDTTLRLIFALLLPCLQQGDQICVSIEPGDRTVSIRIQPETTEPGLLPQAHHRTESGYISTRLELIHALVLNMDGHLRFHQQPYSIEVTLPKASAAMSIPEKTRSVHA